MKPMPLSVPERLLPGVTFSDTYSVVADGQHLDAIEAARRAFGRAPRWVTSLLALRNLLVKPFRLKSGKEPERSAKIGFFPVLAQSGKEIVLGLDDRHLDFRVLVEVTDLGAGRQEISATTAVKTHNLLGRCYLAVVKPFHRGIVPAMLAQVVKT